MSSEDERRGMLPDTQAEADAPSGPAGQRTPASGEVIAGKYEVESLLGVGGMGVVVGARHIQLGQRVAVKFMRAGATDGQAASRFLREARAAAALSSEHVTRVLDVGTLDTGAPYLVMEYLAGVDLSDVLRKDGPMSASHAVGIVLQACEAIAEAHALGIVHRDLKPSNLFVSMRKDGTTLIKVLDFGISKTADLDARGSDGNLTASGFAMGSPSYMSPEQVRNARAVDARSDIWALGVIVFELVTGVRPFDGAGVGETLARIVSEQPPSVRQYRPDLPEGLALVIAQCLERRLERRFQSVAELALKLCPYGPKDAASCVERVLRLSGAPAGRAQAGREALHRPSDGTALGGPWHGSGSTPGPITPAARAARVLGLLAVGSLGVAGAVYALGGRTASSAGPIRQTPSTSSTPLNSTFTIFDASPALEVDALADVDRAAVGPAANGSSAASPAFPKATSHTPSPVRKPPPPPPLAPPPPASSTPDDKDIF